MGQVKGTVWLTNREYFLQTFGADALERVIAALSPDDQAALSRPILPLTWLDYGVFIRFVLAADRILGQGDYRLVEASVAHTARKNLKGLFRFLVSFTTPKFMLHNAQKVWRQYYDKGMMSGQWQGEKEYLIFLKDFPDIPLHHDISNGAWIKESLRISGAKNPTCTHPSCIARGDKLCIFNVTWE